MPADDMLTDRRWPNLTAFNAPMALGLRARSDGRAARERPASVFLHGLHDAGLSLAVGGLADVCHAAAQPVGVRSQRRTRIICSQCGHTLHLLLVLLNPAKYMKSMVMERCALGNRHCGLVAGDAAYKTAGIQNLCDLIEQCYRRLGAALDMARSSGNPCQSVLAASTEAGAAG